MSTSKDLPASRNGSAAQTEHSHPVPEDSARVHTGSSATRRQLAELQNELEELKANLLMDERKIRHEIEKQAQRLLSKKLPFFGVGILTIIGAVWLALWHSDGFHESFWGSVNKGLRLDSYLAKRIQEYDENTKSFSSPLGETIGTRLEKDRKFLRNIVALSFPLHFETFYDPLEETNQQIVFYASSEDVANVICMFGFSHRDKKDLPEKITFKLNGESLTNGEFFIDPISPSGTQMIQISNDELKKTWQPNRLYILSLAIDSVETSKPVGPMASHPIIHERPSSQVSSTFFPKLVGDCFVAVIGRADASPLVPPTSTVGN